MALEHFSDVLAAASEQDEPQRLLLVFAAAELPRDATEQDKAAFARGEGGALAHAARHCRPDRPLAQPGLFHLCRRLQRAWRAVPDRRRQTGTGGDPMGHRPAGLGFLHLSHLHGAHGEGKLARARQVHQRRLAAGGRRHPIAGRAGGADRFQRAAADPGGTEFLRAGDVAQPRSISSTGVSSMASRILFDTPR